MNQAKGRRNMQSLWKSMLLLGEDTLNMMEDFQGEGYQQSHRLSHTDTLRRLSE